MFKGVFLFSCILFVSSAPLCLAQSPADITSQEEADLKSEEEWNSFKLGDDLVLSFNGYFYVYHIRNHNCYQTDADSSFTEISAALGMNFDFMKEFEGEFRVVSTGLYGRPENYLGAQPAQMDSFFDLANVTWKLEVEDIPVKIKAGLQELQYGDGFLVYDGYTEDRAIWTTPVRSFPAIKASVDLGGGNWVDGFAAHVQDDFMSYEAFQEMRTTYATGGSLTGINLHLSDKTFGEIDAAMFRKEEKQGGTLGSDTMALSLRDEVSFETDQMGDFTFTGEVVRQYGETNVVQGAISALQKTRRAWGGQVTGSYHFDMEAVEKYKPYVKARYIHFSGDKKSTSYTEAFDPMFFGWDDWGQWWVGDMTSYQLPHSNAQIYVAEAGLHLTDFSKLRLYYFNSRLLKSTTFSNTKMWSHEINAVYDYYFNDYVFCGLMGGAVIPGSASKKFNGDDEINLEAIAWIGFSF